MGKAFPRLSTINSVLPLLGYLVLFLISCTGCVESVYSHTDSAVEVIGRRQVKVEPPEPVRFREDSGDWRELVLHGRAAPVSERLKAVNSFFNRLPHVEDSLQWGEQEYWATLAETLAMNGGDCEDVSIAKYFTLRELGIPEESLRITYVLTLPLHTPHMVLTYRQSPASEFIVLDTLQDAAVPISKRSDLLPVYSFNTGGYWLARNENGWKGQRLGSAEKLSRWKALLQRMQQQNTGLFSEKSSPVNYRALAGRF